MVESQPQLGRQGSVVPVALHQTESCCIGMPLSKAWGLFKHFKLEHVVPNKVKTTTFETGAPG